jgi:RNA polymerase sigma-32 factor
MNNLINMQLALPIGSLDSYVQSVNKIPLLSLEEEQALARRFRETFL